MKKIFMLLLFAFISLEATTECKDGKECFEKAWEFYKQKGFKKRMSFTKRLVIWATLKAVLF